MVKVAKGKRTKKTKNGGLAAGLTIGAAALIIGGVIFFTMGGLNKGGTVDPADPTPATDGQNNNPGTKPADGVVYTDDKVVTVTVSGTEKIVVDPSKSSIKSDSDVERLIDSVAQRVETPTVDDSYLVDGDILTLTKGVAGFTLDRAGILSYIRSAFSGSETGDISTDQFSIAQQGLNQPTPLDLDAVYAAVHTEKTDAYFDKELQEVVPAVRGVTFDVNYAKEQFAPVAAGESIDIRLTIDEPEVTDLDFEAIAYPDLLSSRTTKMATSRDARANNIKLAAAAVNGTVLKPGDVFSFNGVVGQRTTAKGYGEAPAYISGEIVDTVGGGICQVSSTLYWCTLKAELEVVMRYNHRWAVTYIENGFDATVSWPNLDYQFKNNQEYPILIKAWVEGNELTVEFHGTKTNDHKVILQLERLGKNEFSTVYKEDETLKPGEEKVESKGSDGPIVQTYMYVYDGEDNLLYKKAIAKSSYKPHDRVILVGPDITEPEPEPTPEPDPTPTPEPDPTPTPEPDPTPEPEPDPTPEPEPDPTPEPEPDPTPEPEPDPTPEPEPDPTPEPEPDPTPEPEPDPTPEPEPDPGE